MASLQDPFISRVRVKLIQAFLSEPQEIFYVRQLVRDIGEEINAVRRELVRMEKRGMLVKEKRGNRLYYNFRKDYPYYHELLRLATKTTGLGKAIIKAKNRLGKIKYAFITTRLVRRRPHREDDVDLVLVGDVVIPQVAALISRFENEFGHEINYSAMSKEEFEFRKKRRDPFLLKVLTQSRIILIGDEVEMAE